MSQKSVNGEHFTPILRKIHNILQQLAIREWYYQTGHELTLESDKEERLQLALRHLTTETVPAVIMHLSNISMNIEEMSKVLLDVICYLMSLDPSCPLSYPVMFASCLLYVDSSGWTSGTDLIINHLCYYALPMSILYSDKLKGRSDLLSMSATLMLVFDNQSCDLRHHMLIMTVFMMIKLNVCTDLLSVIAYGTPRARSNALRLLLHYWPLASSQHFTYNDPFSNLEIPCPDCEATRCSNPASYLCLEGSCTTQFSKLHSKDGNKKLFSLLCSECDSVFHRNISDKHKRLKLAQPLRDVKPNCELRRECVSSEGEGSSKSATVTCFGETCTAIQNGHPIRLCNDCHQEQHKGITQSDLHIYQVGPQNPWTCQDMAAASALLEAIGKLLQTPPGHSNTRKDSQRRNSSYSSGPAPRYSLKVDGGREGILMLKQYCVLVGPVKQGREKEWLEHLIALLLEWLRLFNELVQNIMRDFSDDFNGSFMQFLSSGHKSSEHICSNQRELYCLIIDNAIPWLKSVCDTGNTSCIATPLLPHLSGHVQVGEMWSYSTDPILRHKRTLSILTLIVKSSLLPPEAMDQLYNEVMPQWMDLLVELRSSPGEMDKLKDLFHTLFPTDLVHDIRIKRFEFIRELFSQRSSKSKQRALHWLQDLSRLSVIVPYTSHIFEGAMQHRRFRRQGSMDAGGGQDEGQEEEEESIFMKPSIRKESTGSISGYESESGLVSQTSMEGTDTLQVIVQMNNTLPRYILMLDIWCSQMVLDRSSLSYEVLQKYLVFMLETDWKTDHSLHDHHTTTTNTCIFCQAISLWFSLSLRIIKDYINEEEERDDVPDGCSTPVLPKRGRVSIKFAIPTLKRKHTQPDLGSTSSAAQDDYDDQWGEGGAGFEPPNRKKGSIFSKSSADTANTEPLEEEVNKPSPPTFMHRDRRPPIMTRYSVSEFELLSSVASTPTGGGAATPTGHTSSKQPEVTSNLYKIFKLSVKKLNNSYHPDTILQIIHNIHLLVTRGHVLNGGDGVLSVVEDSQHLVERLWRIMECEVSYVHQHCVDLLLAVQDGLFSIDGAVNSVQSCYLWRLLHDGLSNKKWTILFKTADKLTMMLQYISRHEVPVYILKLQPHTELILGYGFCKMIRLVQDKDTRVSTRVQYCLNNMKQRAFEVVRGFMLTLFTKCPIYRGLVLQSLSLLKNSVTSFPFLSIEFFFKLLKEENPNMEELLPQHSQFSKKVSDASVLSGSGRGPRPSTASSAFSAPGYDEEDNNNTNNTSTDTAQLHYDSVLTGVYTSLSVSQPLGGGAVGGAGGREEEEEVDSSGLLSVASPVTYLLEDVTVATHFTQEITIQSLVNLAKYLELIPESFSSLFWNLTNLDCFLKQLKEHPIVLHGSFNAVLRVIIKLLKFCDSNNFTYNAASSITLGAILTEFPDIIMEGLHNVYIPAGGIVSLVGAWHKAFFHYPSAKRREVAKKFLLLKSLIEEFSEGLSHNSSVLPDNLINLCQSFVILLNEYVYFGYIETLWEKRVYTQQLLDQEIQDIQLSSLVNSCEGIEVAFNNALRYAVNYLASELSQAPQEISCQVKLSVSQLVVLRVNRSNYPIDIIRRIVEGQYSLSWVEKSQKIRNIRSADHHSVDMHPGDNINPLMLLGWLFLGSLCHNSVHSAVIRGGIHKMERVLSTECEILLRLASPINKVVSNILHLVIRALQGLTDRNQYYGFNCILCFCTIWTVYMELHINDAVPEIVNSWRMIVDIILDLPTKQGMVILYRCRSSF
uniref:Uncharacterized protein n=1 Tax=Amphimedon queenslandica TaxID=400682 RepID=A0A1X7UW71_AMPQE